MDPNPADEGSMPVPLAVLITVAKVRIVDDDNDDCNGTPVTVEEIEDKDEDCCDDDGGLSSDDENDGNADPVPIFKVFATDMDRAIASATMVSIVDRPCAVVVEDDGIVLGSILPAFIKFILVRCSCCFRRCSSSVCWISNLFAFSWGE